MNDRVHVSFQIMVISGYMPRSGIDGSCGSGKTKIMACGAITSWELDGETVETVTDFLGEAPKSLQIVIPAMKLKDTYSLQGKL